VPIIDSAEDSALLEKWMIKQLRNIRLQVAGQLGESGLSAHRDNASPRKVDHSDDFDSEAKKKPVDDARDNNDEEDDMNEHDGTQDEAAIADASVLRSEQQLRQKKNKRRKRSKA
jgi:hypothetical protein